MPTKASRTTNRLHFTDLSDKRFEDLCHALVYPMVPWSDIRHYGRSGSDGGMDIYAKERLEDGAERDWIVQCRRYSSATRRTVMQAVDDAVATATTPPHVLVLALACDVSRVAHEAFLDHATAKGVETPLIWTASVLEARLYAERPDLLFAYFGISTAARARSRESMVTRNIAMKKRLRRELIKDRAEIDGQKARHRPYEKFRSLRMLIHSVDDTTYPNVETSRTRRSGWFRLEVWDFYFNGLEFIVAAEPGILHEDGRWAIRDFEQAYDEASFSKITVLTLGQIPYSAIVDVDLDGDEFYGCPHVYCRFAHGGWPYEGFAYVRGDGDYPWPLEAGKRFELPAARRPDVAEGKGETESV